jgi:hypothetical protein
MASSAREGLVRAWLRRKVASALFEDWARRKYPKVRNPMQDGRKDEITFDTFLGYARSGDAGAQRMLQQMRAEYARSQSEGAQLDMWPDHAAKTDEDFDELVGGYEDWNRPELDQYLKSKNVEGHDWSSASGTRMVNFEIDGERYVGEEDEDGGVVGADEEEGDGEREAPRQSAKAARPAAVEGVGRP